MLGACFGASILTKASDAEPRPIEIHQPALSERLPPMMPRAFRGEQRLEAAESAMPD